MRQCSELEEVRRAIAGDDAAFAGLVGRYRDAVYGVCYHRVGHLEEAKDLAQEAFLRAYLDLRQLRDPAAFPAWLRRVTERVCSTWQRRKRLQMTSLESAPEPVQTRELDLPLAIRQALGHLTDDARLAVTLYYINGYSTREVAGFLGVPTGTVKSRLYHARRKLKGELMDVYKDALREKAPGAEFEGAIIRAVRSLEELRSFKHSEAAYPESEEALGRYLVLEKDGSVLGVCYYNLDEMPIRRVNVQIVRAGYTTGEGEWQDKGFDVYDRLATGSLANVAELGFVLAATHEELMCATRHGYVPCFYHHRIQVPAANLAGLEARGKVRKFRKSDAHAVEGLRALPRARPTMWAWQGWEDEPPFVLERDGEVVGHYCLAPKHRTGPPVLINEMEGTEMQGYRAMAKHCAKAALREGVDMITTYLSSDHPLGALMLARGGAAEMQGASWDVAKDEELVCILDLSGALRAVAPGLGRLPKGRVGIDMDGEAVTITSGEPPSIKKGLSKGAQASRIGRVPITQLVVGYRSVFEIAGRADVEIRDEDLEALDALFPKTWPYSWPDPYIWNKDSLRESRPWAFEEPWRSRLAAHARPWT